MYSRALPGFWVYPRACGGTMERRIYCHREQGLSPRVRGNQPVHDDANIRLGSIPARAGEPVLDQPFPLEIRVYPRACGGTAFLMAQS